MCIYIELLSENIVWDKAINQKLKVSSWATFEGTKVLPAQLFISSMIHELSNNNDFIFIVIVCLVLFSFNFFKKKKTNVRALFTHKKGHVMSCEKIELRLIDWIF